MVADITSLREKLDSDEVDILDSAVSEWMVKEKGIASIPVSAFLSNSHKAEHSNFLRFCFIKADKTLDAAEEKFKLLK